jgi:hypothetical protein
MLITTPAESTTTRRTCPHIIAATMSLGGTGVSAVVSLRRWRGSAGTADSPVPSR